MMPTPAFVASVDSCDRRPAELLRQLRRKHASRYEAFQPISVEVGDFCVRTPRAWDELWQIFRLRHEVFWREQRGRSQAFDLDVDALDLSCDHLGIFETSSGRLLGSYRLTSSQVPGAAQEFYSAKRFYLEPLLSLSAPLVELGRACVDRSARGAIVMNLLWRGIAAYAAATGSRYLFGVSSVSQFDSDHLQQLMKWLAEKDHISQQLRVPLRDGWQMSNLTLCSGGFGKSLPPIPPVFLSYLRAGAKVCADPAWDKEMHCADFLTVLDLQGASGRLKRRFLR